MLLLLSSCSPSANPQVAAPRGNAPSTSSIPLASTPTPMPRPVPVDLSAYTDLAQELQRVLKSRDVAGLRALLTAPRPARAVGAQEVIGPEVVFSGGGYYLELSDENLRRFFEPPMQATRFMVKDCHQSCPTLAVGILITGWGRRLMDADDRSGGRTQLEVGNDDDVVLVFWLPTGYDPRRFFRIEPSAGWDPLAAVP